MNFLKRHYEKLLLVLMLIIFLVTLFYQVDIITGARQITPEDLKLPPMHADYENTKFTQPEFEDVNIFMKNTVWVPTKPKNPADKVFTDLMVNFEASRCPHKDCEKIVPRYFFMNKPHKCPICGGDLPTPKPRGPNLPPPLPPSEGDSDGDGIPDLEEEKIGSNPKQADSGNDTDGDGFANIYEYKNNTHGGKARSHPPLWQRLYVKDVRRTLLDIKLKKITALGTDKSDWDVQVNTKGGTKTKFLAIDDVIRINNKDYILVDIRVKKVKTRKKSVVVEDDISEITLKSTKGDDTIVAIRNNDVYSSKPQAILIDELDGKEYTIDEGAILTIGSPQTEREKYQILKVDPAKEDVIMKDLKRKRTVRITKDLLIPKIRKEVEMSREGMDDEFGPDGPPSMGNPGKPKRKPGQSMI